MMNSGMQKPPLAPKPKLTQFPRSGMSPSTPRRDVLSLPSPGAPRRVKPVLAPKPCLSKLTKPLALMSPDQTPVTETPKIEGLLNSQNGIQQESKKPDWDYIIPICLCSQENCMCISSTDRKQLRGSADNSVHQLMYTSTNTNHKPLETSDRTLNTSSPARPSLPHRTWSDEANGNVTPQGAPGRGPEDDDQSKAAPAASRKPIPVPVPRKPRTPVLARQEKVEEESEEIASQEGREMGVKEVKVSSEGKDSSSLSVSVPAGNRPPLSARKAFAQPAPPPRKKPLLSTPEKTSAPPKDVEEYDLGWDSSSSSQEMEVSVDKEDEEVEEEVTHNDQEAVYSDFTPPSSSLLAQPELSRPCAVTVAAEDGPVKVPPRKPQRHSSPMAWMQRKDSSEEEWKSGDDEKRQAVLVQESLLKERLMRELPSPPDEKRLSTPGITKPPRSNLGKQRSKSFSGADLLRPTGPKRNSFRKLLDLKLSVKMLPKLIAKGGQSSEHVTNHGDGEQSMDRDQGGCQDLLEHLRAPRKFSFPLIGVEQSVDGDEFSPRAEQADYYENMPYYEEIPDYMNICVGRAATSPQAFVSQPAGWQYNDEGIYEEQEPYMSLEKNTERPQCWTATDYERSSVDEEVAPLDDGTSDDDILANTSEDEDDSSSVSSKGDAEQPEENSSGQKKSKIHHIATEIMSSESVFVDVLKLLHVDFRDAASMASRQSGKPVIEERLLNQILYYLPQLYELNQDLLKELKNRVAKWDENAKLADIFLKKGPYLKMYSTYIREFDKNVALLEEQSKKNPAFGAVVREFEASPRCASLALKHYLLKPVQRIPQYRLLLTDYLKNLSEDSDDYKDTQAALEIVKEVANHANDIMKQGDNFQKLIQVQCRLNGHHEIVQPGRIFLKEGSLKKLSRKVMQPRMFFLFNDTLLYTTPVQSGQYKVKNMLSLAGMKVSKPSQEAYQNELNIESVERSFILSASSAIERDEWLEAISTAISDYTRKKISFISGKPPEEVELTDDGDDAPLGSKAPIWIPDPRTTMCMICTCEFTLTWRRHHCRACGKVVCQSCSTNKYCLEYLKNQLARVCDQCFPVLQQQKSKRALASAVSPGNRGGFGFSRKQKKIPAALKEVTASTDNSSMSGYLQRSKGNKKQGKRLWFVIKDKVLYTYAASEDVAASESQPLLGFMLKVDSSQKLTFKLYHKNTLYHIFKADDVQTAQRWIDSFKAATIFLKEGSLKKLSRKVMQPRMFFLFNDTLLYTTPVQSGQYKVKNMLSLAGMKVSKPSQEAYQNELNIESVERSFILSASSAIERDEWLEAISTAISDYTRKKISFISGKPPEEVELTDDGDDAPLGSKAPIWIPDPRTTMCMICTCEFTLTWRRHHCRACGKVVCQSCSTNKYCLEYLKNQLARVCDQCFPVLQQQKSKRALASAVSPGNRGGFGFSRKQKKIPAALKEVTASTDNSSMSGYLQRSKGNKKQGKRLWFVIKDKVLYTYAASEDVAASESQPLLGFMLKVDSSQKLTFKLYHKNTLYHIFKADDVQTAQRWIDSFKAATVL